MTYLLLKETDIEQRITKHKRHADRLSTNTCSYHVEVEAVNVLNELQSSAQKIEVINIDAIEKDKSFPLYGLANDALNWLQENGYKIIKEV